MRDLGTPINPQAEGEPLPPDAQLVVRAHYADARGFQVGPEEVFRTPLSDPLLGTRLRNLSRLFNMKKTSESHLRKGHGGGA